MNGESTSMVWPTLGSRTAKEQNRCVLRMMTMNSNCEILPEYVVDQLSMKDYTSSCASS